MLLYNENIEFIELLWIGNLYCMNGIGMSWRMDAASKHWDFSIIIKKKHQAKKLQQNQLFRITQGCQGWLDANDKQ